MNAFGQLVLRVGIGLLMLKHGIDKAKMLFQGNADLFPDPIGWGSTLSLTTATLAELVGSLLVVVGLLTRASALSVAFTMAVAAFLVHGGDPWFTGQGVARAKEPALVYMVAFLAITLLGPGAHSFDAYLAAKKGRPGS